MQTIQTTIPHNLNLLHEQLIALIPTFRRVEVINGEPTATPDNGTLESDGTTLTITFADDILVAEVQGDITAHVATDLSQTQRDLAEWRIDFARIDELRNMAPPPLVGADLSELVVLLGKFVVFFFKDPADAPPP